MKFFVRTRALSNMLVALSLPFIFLTVRIIHQGETTERIVRFIVFFLCSVLFLGLGIVLKVIVKDAREDLAAITKYYDAELDKRKEEKAEKEEKPL